MLFVSAGKTLEDRLAGYEAGGDAYICKPFDIRELHAIVASLISRKEISDGHLQDLDSLQALSWTMMKNNCEMGELLKFSRSISSLRNESAFVTQLFKTLSHFNLNVTLLVRLVSGEIVTRSDGKPFTLIEKELLELAREDTRITCHGSKYIFTAQNLVLLVKNMPVQDEDLTGRLKDHLCMLLDAAQTCVELLNFSKHREREGVRQRELILNTIREEFNNMNRLAEQIFEQSNASVEKLAGNLEHAFTFMDLTEDQERHMLDFIAVSRREIDKQEYCKAQFAQSLNRMLHAVGGAAQGVALEEPG
ncbi:MAG: hypothetical protein MI864_23200 [Pseudomonadales bacterium]|nr:hypothetical protein [Pseudomonadales bacterium]